MADFDANSYHNACSDVISSLRKTIFARAFLMAENLKISRIITNFKYIYIYIIAIAKCMLRVCRKYCEISFDFIHSISNLETLPRTYIYVNRQWWEYIMNGIYKSIDILVMKITVQINDLEIIGYLS